MVFFFGSLPEWMRDGPRVRVWAFEEVTGSRRRWQSLCTRTIRCQDGRWELERLPLEHLLAQLDFFNVVAAEGLELGRHEGAHLKDVFPDG